MTCLSHHSKFQYALFINLLITGLVFLFSCKKKPELHLSDLLKIKPDAVNSQIFWKNDTNDFFCKAKNNTFLFFDKNSWEIKNAKSDSIKVELKELSTVNDFMKTRVTTFTHQKLLQLSGVVFIAASSKDKRVSLNLGKSFYLFFPRVAGNVDMKFYKGNLQAAGNLSWEPVEAVGSRQSAVGSAIAGATIASIPAKDQYVWFWEGPFVDKADEMDNEKAVKAKGTLLTTQHFYERVCYFKNDARYWKDSLFHKTFRLLFDIWYEHRSENLTMEELDELAIQEMQLISEPISQKYFSFAQELSRKYGNSGLVFPEKKIENNLPVSLLEFLKKQKIELSQYSICGSFDKTGWYACGKEVTEPDHFTEPLKILSDDSVKFCQVGFINPEYKLISHQIIEGVHGKFYFVYPPDQLLDVAVLGYSQEKLSWGRGFNLSPREIHFLKVKSQP